MVGRRGCAVRNGHRVIMRSKADRQVRPTGRRESEAVAI